MGVTLAAGDTHPNIVSAVSAARVHIMGSTGGELETMHEQREALQRA